MSLWRRKDAIAFASVSLALPAVCGSSSAGAVLGLYFLFAHLLCWAPGWTAQGRPQPCVLASCPMCLSAPSHFPQRPEGCPQGHTRTRAWHCGASCEAFGTPALNGLVKCLLSLRTSAAQTLTLGGRIRPY